MALDLRFCWKNKHMPRYGTCVRLGLKTRNWKKTSSIADDWLSKNLPFLSFTPIGVRHTAGKP
jgi:hypothetical protein